MSSDLWLIQDLGEQLKPSTDHAPADLRRRVLAGAAPARSRTRQPARFRMAWPSWRLTVMTVAAATALVLSGIIGNPLQTVVRPPVTEAKTASQVLRLAANHVALAPRPLGRPDQFTYSESVATFDTLDTLQFGGSWVIVKGRRTLVREWRPVSGARDGLTQYRPMDGPEVPWRSEPIVACRADHGAPSACTPALSESNPLPTDGDVMYEFLYRSTHDDISAAYAALIDDDALAYERAARTLYLGQTSPAVQAAVLAAMTRIPGVTVRVDATDVSGRHGVALVRQGPLGPMELIFDSTKYQYLGMNLMIESPARMDLDHGFSMRLMTRQAVQQSAIVDNVGDVS